MLVGGRNKCIPFLQACSPAASHAVSNHCPTQIVPLEIAAFFACVCSGRSREVAHCHLCGGKGAVFAGVLLLTYWEGLLLELENIAEENNLPSVDLRTGFAQVSVL